jgi:hypothetical protein
VISTQKIFALARPAPAVSWADMVPAMQQEAAHLWSLYERGIVRGAWVRTDALGAVYELESTPAGAIGVLEAQPLARFGLVSFEVVPVGPFTPLALLFGTEHRSVSPHPTPARGQRTQTVLAIDSPVDGVSPEEITALLPAEARHAWSLWKAGVVRASYLRTDRTGVAIVLETSSSAEADEILAELPLVHAGLITFECQALAAFTGYDALFDGSLESGLIQLHDPTSQPLPLPATVDREERTTP